MGLLLAPLILLVGLAMFVAFCVGGLWTVAASLRRSTPHRGAVAGRGIAKLLAALLVAAVPWVAASYAEASTGWVDTDHDGMLDGFSNGSYDWVDINGGAWATAASVLIVVIGGCLALTLAGVRQPRREAELQRPQPVGD